MSDLVQRLRGRANGMWPAGEGSSLLREAAGCIEELEALLREAHGEIQAACDRADFMGDETAALLARIDAAIQPGLSKGEDECS